jgi:Cof subfamily protein (haloacid dehalogenase superfamily)
MIRLLALDLDQTLFGNDLVMTPRVQRAIAGAQAKGTQVTIVTGREAYAASRVARDLKITAPIVCAQGACIFDHVHNEVLHDERLPMELLPRILAVIERHGWNVHLETFDKLFFPPASSHSAAFFELLRYSNWVRVGDLVNDLPEPPLKFIVTVERTEDRATVVEVMHREFGDAITVVPSHPHLVEGVPAGVHKGHGLAWLAGHLHVAQSEVMAIGDSEADIPMIRWAGIGVAMGNATPETKAAADWVAPTLSEDGAAVAIEKFIGLEA